MEIEIPNIDLTTVDTGIPLLPDGLYEVRVENASVEPSKDGSSQILKLKYSLEQNATSIGGNEVNPGFPIFDRVSLKVTEKYNPARRLASLMDCFIGQRAPKLNPEELIGKSGSVRLRIRRDENYGDSNEVKAYEPKK